MLNEKRGMFLREETHESLMWNGGCGLPVRHKADVVDNSQWSLKKCNNPRTLPLSIHKLTQYIGSYVRQLVRKSMLIFMSALKVGRAAD